MGKIIKFDPDRRRKGTGRAKHRRSWTRPEDYGVASRPKVRRPAPLHTSNDAGTSSRTALLAKLTVAGVIAVGMAVSFFGLS